MAQQAESVKQKRAPTMGETIGIAVILMGAILAFWSNTQTRLALLEMNQRNADLDRGRIELKLDKINMKMDDKKDAINEINITTQQKISEIKIK